MICNFASDFPQALVVAGRKLNSRDVYTSVVVLNNGSIMTLNSNIVIFLFNGEFNKMWTKTNQTNASLTIFQHQVAVLSLCRYRKETSESTLMHSFPLSRRMDRHHRREKCCSRKLNALLRTTHSQYVPFPSLKRKKKERKKDRKKKSRSWACGDEPGWQENICWRCSHRSPSRSFLVKIKRKEEKL